MHPLSLFSANEPAAGSSPGSDEPDIRLPYHSKSMAGLALASSVLIAGIMTVPDAIALIPVCTTPVSWALGTIGVWLSVLVLWFVSFMGLLHAVRIIQGSPRVTVRGIKLGRLERTIPWSRVRAITVEEQPVFGRLLGRTAWKASIYHSKKQDQRWHQKALPSLCFDADEFQTFSRALASRVAGQTPQSHLVFATDDLQRLKSSVKFMRNIQLVVMAIMVISVGSGLGRKAATNYTYNLANTYMEDGKLNEALRGYETVTKLEPSFAAGWHNLATTEFKLNRWDDAEKHWLKALFFKPDMVEPKVSLAFIHLKRRQFDQAHLLLSHALKRAPGSVAARLNQAEYYMRIGDTGSAVEQCNLVLGQKKRNVHAACLLAQAQVRAGHPEDALDTLDHIARTRPYAIGEFFYLYSRGQALAAVNHTSDAQAHFDAILSKWPNHTDVLLAKCQLAIATGDLSKAEELAGRAKESFPESPWPWLAECEIATIKHDQANAESALDHAASSPSQDLLSAKRMIALAIALGRQDIVKTGTTMVAQLEQRVDAPPTQQEEIRYWLKLSRAARGT